MILKRWNLDLSSKRIHIPFHLNALAATLVTGTSHLPAESWNLSPEAMVSHPMSRHLVQVNYPAAELRGIKTQNLIVHRAGILYTNV
jgi:hypothetical protein